MNILIRAVALLALLCYPAYSHERSSSDDGGFSISFGSISYKELGELNGGVLTIKDRVNLQNKQCVIPEGITLCFKGGLIQNGTLVGNMTKLKTCGVCFNRVKILGTWNVPSIKSSFFYDLSYENALKEVVGLSNPNIKNRITIDEGNYLVSAYKNADICIPINSNTEFILNGTINLLPNEYTNYYIIQATGSNIKIKGKGTIVGDKFNHTGKTGEWGMGINLHQAHHVSISNLTIKDCWGDCIYVGGNSTDVTIKDCRLDNGRRQGISITSGNNLLIKNCIITNIKGTSPEYAIDIEPNRNDTINTVMIDGCRVFNCRGGITTNGKAEEAHIGSVTLRSCKIFQITFHAPIQFRKTDNVIIEGCNIDIDKIKFVFRFQGVKQATIRNNEITTKRFLLEPCSNITLDNNTIQCGGFYAEGDGEKHRNIIINGNTFVKRMPKMEKPNKSLGIIIENNKVAE